MARNLRKRWWLLAERLCGLSQERAQTLAEYGLIIAVVSTVVVVTALTLFSTQLGGAFTNAADCIDGC